MQKPIEMRFHSKGGHIDGGIWGGCMQFHTHK